MTHWDFMLEHNGVLRTWALDAEPSDGTVVTATPLVDHRLDYLDYEGEISGGRGDVDRCDRGSYTAVGEDEQRIEVALVGKQLVGRATITYDDHDQRWRFVFDADAAF